MYKIRLFNFLDFGLSFKARLTWQLERRGNGQDLAGQPQEPEEQDLEPEEAQQPAHRGCDPGAILDGLDYSKVVFFELDPCCCITSFVIRYLLLLWDSLRGSGSNR